MYNESALFNQLKTFVGLEGIKYNKLPKELKAYYSDYKYAKDGNRMLAYDYIHKKVYIDMERIPKGAFITLRCYNKKHDLVFDTHKVYQVVDYPKIKYFNGEFHSILELKNIVRDKSIISDFRKALDKALDNKYLKTVVNNRGVKTRIQDQIKKYTVIELIVSALKHMDDSYIQRVLNAKIPSFDEVILNK